MTQIWRGHFRQAHYHCSGHCNARPALAALYRGLRGGVASLRVLAASFVLSFSGSVAEACSDLAIVLAIDASGSVNDADFRLQQDGYARALLSPRVQAAIRSAGQVEMGVVVWGDSDWPPQVLPLARVASVADSVALAGRIASLPRNVSGNTGIGRGVWAATDLLEAQAACALRRVINVSGDGIESVAPRPRTHIPLDFARKRAVDAGITINGLAIDPDRTGIGLWYRDRVIGGPSAFAMEVSRYADFALAIEQKLAREIAPPTVAALTALPPEARRTPAIGP